MRTAGALTIFMGVLAVSVASAQDHGDAHAPARQQAQADIVAALPEDKSAGIGGAQHADSATGTLAFKLRRELRALLSSGAAAAHTQHVARLDDDAKVSSSDEMPDSANARSEPLVRGYSSRPVGPGVSSFLIRSPDTKLERPSFYSRDAYSRRLFLVPAPNWMLQISRGHVSSLDQLDPGGDVRRSIISASYNSQFDEGGWQTTLAWGRHGGRFRESTMGYLAESSLRIARLHTVFGRLEQVGSNDLLRENESMQRQLFKMNKLTIGYVYDAGSGGPVRFDIGGMVSRHAVPQEMASTYGTAPTAYWMFIRLKLQ
ncbi:hypothetical protein [Noviherbaspirillum cavernae]|nr:hypothetical protein [Noviherbaspirillum cavernae]